MKNKIWEIVLTKDTLEDLSDIADYSRKNFGEQAKSAYENLIDKSLADIQNDPLRVGSKARIEIAEDFRSYHTQLSRDKSMPKVYKPRHIVFYFLVEDRRIVVSRILHEIQDVERNIPTTHKKRPFKDAP